MLLMMMMTRYESSGARVLSFKTGILRMVSEQDEKITLSDDESLRELRGQGPVFQARSDVRSQDSFPSLRCCC